MATKINATTIGTYIRDRIYTNLRVELSLATCQLGDLRRVHWPASEDAAAYSSLVPAVFVLPLGFTMRLATLNQRYEAPYQLRVVYVRTYDEGVTAFQALETWLGRCADQVLEDYRFSAGPIALSQAQMKIARVSGGDFDPPENEWLRQVGAQLHAAAITVDVETITWNTV